MAWLYVPVDTDLKRDCILFCPEPTAPYVLLNGKPTPLLAWSRQWKTKPWRRFLSGMMLPHSILNRGVDSYISSLRDIHASLSASPESVWEKMTRKGTLMTKPRFYVYKSTIGQIFICDRSQATPLPGSGAIALFFKEKAHPERAVIMAEICAKVLNEESARRKGARHE